MLQLKYTYFISLLFAVPTFSVYAQQTAALCIGETKILKAHSSEASSYQWYKDGIPITGAESSSIIVSSLGDYNVVCNDIDGCRSKPSELIHIIRMQPVAYNDTIIANKAVTMYPLLNDKSTCSALDMHSFEIVSFPMKGTIIINEDGSITYTPTGMYSGIDSFTYKIADLDGVYSNIATVKIYEDNPLNISFLSFTANKVNNNVLLAWKISKQSEILRFEIQRSLHINDWQIIGYQEFNTPYNLEDQYTFLDTFPRVGNNYYRVKLWKNNNTFSYSEIKAVTFDKHSDVVIYPNPAKENIHIMGLIGNERIEIYDISGRNVKEVNANQSLMVIPINSLINGMYEVRIIGIDNSISIFKFIKND